MPTPLLPRSLRLLTTHLTTLCIVLLGLLGLQGVSHAQPAAPTALNATITQISVGVGKITLTWTGSTGATSYNLYRRISGSPYNYTAPLTSTTAPTVTYEDNAITSGTTYAYVVRAVNGSGESANSNEKFASYLPPVTHVLATSGNAQVVLNWDATTGATLYQVFRSTTSGSYGAALGTSTTNTYTDSTGLTNGTTYYYIVRARNAGGTSDDSNEATASPSATVPPAPTALTATGTETSPGVGRIVVAWTGNIQSDKYKIYRREAGPNPAFLLQTTINRHPSTSYAFNNTGVTPGTRYEYFVRGVNGSGESADSNYESGTFLPAITNLRSSSGNQKVQLNWSAITGAQSYQVFRRPSTNPNYSSPFPETILTPDYLDTTLPSTGTYYYVVKSINAAGASNYSNEVSATSTTSVPVAPTALVATGSETAPGSGVGKVTLNWNGSTTTTGIVEYNIYRRTAGSSTFNYINSLPGISAGASDAGNSYTYTDTNITTGTRYEYVVRAENPNGESADSNPESATYLLPVTDLSGTPASTKVTLNWSTVSGAQSYQIFRHDSSTTNYTLLTSVTPTSPIPPTLSYINNGLTNDTLYYYVVKAANAAGTSVFSNEISLAPPGAPIGLSATGSNTSVALTWIAQSPARSYKLRRATSASGPYTVVYTGTNNSFTDTTGLTYNTTYYYTVSSTLTGLPESPTSAPVSATTVSTPPAPVVTATAGNHQITLSWVGPYADLYVVKIGSSTITTTSSTSYVHTNLLNGVTRSYQVFAKNTSLPSSQQTSPAGLASATPVGPPNAITLTATGTAQSARVAWNDDPAASSYVLSRKQGSGNWLILSQGAYNHSQLYYDDALIAYGTTNYYRLVTSNSYGSTTSNTAYFTALATPTNLQASRNNWPVLLSWDTTPAGTGDSYNYFIIRRYTGSSTTYIEIPVSSRSDFAQVTYLDTNVTNSLGYTYRVVAVAPNYSSPNSTSNVSNSVTVEPFVSTPPPTSDPATLFSSGELYVGLSDGDVEVYTPPTTLGTSFNYKGTLVDTSSPQTAAGGIAFDNNNQLVVARGSQGIKRFPYGGSGFDTFKSVTPGGALTNPTSIATRSLTNPPIYGGGYMAVGQAGNNNVAGFFTDGTVAASTGAYTPSNWVALSTDGVTYYSNGNVVRRYSGSVELTPITLPSDPGYSANALAILPGGGVLVAAGKKILALRDDGTPLGQYDMPNIDNWATLTLSPPNNIPHAPDFMQFPGIFYASPGNSSDIYAFIMQPGENTGGQLLSSSGVVTSLSIKDSATTEALPHRPFFSDEGAAIEAGPGQPISITPSYGDYDFGETLSASASVSAVATGSGSGSVPVTLNTTTDGDGKITYSFTTPSQPCLITLEVTVSDHQQSDPLANNPPSKRQYLVNVSTGTRHGLAFTTPTAVTNPSETYGPISVSVEGQQNSTPKIDRVLTFDEYDKNGDTSASASTPVGSSITTDPTLPATNPDGLGASTTIYYEAGMGYVPNTIIYVISKNSCGEVAIFKSIKRYPVYP